MASAATIAAVHATATASSTTPSTTTTTTADKYDRQLRVWGADGQRQLRDTCVVLIQATAAGTETLKNLVLPGVGAYTVVDDYSCVGRKNVAGAATASAERPPVYTGQCNFFVDEAPRNATATAPCTTPISRAESAGTLLQELNPDVQGSWCHVPDIEAKNMDWTTMLQRAAHVEGWKSTMDHADGNTNDTLCMVRTSSAPAQVDSTTPAWTTRHLLVVASDLPLVVVDRVAAACRATSTTQLLVVQSYGLVGTVRWAYVPPTVVLQPRTTAPPEWGLTLGCVASTAAKDDSGAGNNNNNNRFEALEALVDETEQQWDGLSDRDRGHVPFPILLKVVQRQFCKKNNSGQLPRTADEKRAFVEMVKALGRPRDATNNGATATTSTTATLNTNDLPLNVQQAVQHAYTAYTERPLDMDRLRALQCTLVDASSNTSSASNTRHVARLLTSLLDTSYLSDRHGQPPLQGSIPDLASSTDWYMRLQTVYRQRAAEDVAALAAAAASTTSGDGTEDTIPTDVVQAVCQNLRHLTVTDVPYVPSDATVSEAVGAALVEAATDDAEDGDEHVAQQSPLLWYVAVQAGHVFYQRHGRYPGTRPVGKDDQDNDDTMDDTDTNEDDPTFLQDDVQKLHPCLVDTVARYRLDQCSVVTEALLSHGNDTKNTNPYAQEIVRWGHADLHTIASVVGGVAAQEAVKGVTGQYVPLDTTYVYNGIASRGGVYPV